MKNNPKKDQFRVNWGIKVPQVRVIKNDLQLGVMSTEEARRLAQESGLDLVEIVPTAKPPVCKIMNFSHFKYEEQLRQKEAEKRQRESKIQVKEIRLRPCTADHDVGIKAKQAQKFLEDGMKVQFNIQFRGQRELSHKENGFLIIQRILQELSQFCIIDKPPKMEGSRIICCLSPTIRS